MGDVISSSSIHYLATNEDQISFCTSGLSAKAKIIFKTGCGNFLLVHASDTIAGLNSSSPLNQVFLMVSLFPAKTPPFSEFPVFNITEPPSTAPVLFTCPLTQPLPRPISHILPCLSPIFLTYNPSSFFFPFSYTV